MSALKWTHNLVSMQIHYNYNVHIHTPALYTHLLHYMYILLISLVKGYLRKGQALIGMKELDRAQQAYQKVLDIDPNNSVSIASLLACHHLFN